MANEINGEKKPVNKPGLYVHKETGAKVELNVSPGIGTPQIDAFIQAGFVKAEKVEEPKAPLKK